MAIDIFNRKDLIGDQSINTINNFNEYLDSLLNPFNNQITELFFELDTITINKEVTYNVSLVNKLQINNIDILNKYNLINDLQVITNKCNTYITELNSNKVIITNMYNNKALPTSSLSRPILKTVINSDKSAINKQYITNEVLKYSLPIPTPNTRLYVSKDCKSLFWA